MQLREFFDYKNVLMKDILTNQNIISLLKDGETLENASELAYTQVFPLEYVPKTVDSGLTYICFDVDVKSVSNKTFLTPILYIWIYAHRDNLILPNHRGIRPDELCSEVCNVINGSRYYGLGEFSLYGTSRYAPMTDYQGKMMTFYGKDFNRQHDGAKPVPSNRKII